MHDRLEGEKQSVRLQGRLDALADRHAGAMLAALRLGQAIGGETIAAGTFCLGERRFRARHDILCGRRLLRERDAADRDGDIDRARAGIDRRLAHRRQDEFRDRGNFRPGTIDQQDAEAIAADASEGVVAADAALEPPADLDENGIGRLVAEGVIDHRHVVDADDEIGARNRRRGAAADDVVDGVAQSQLVGKPGQFVEIRQLLKA